MPQTKRSPSRTRFVRRKRLWRPIGDRPQRGLHEQHLADLRSLALVLDSVHDAVIVCDLDLRILRWNHAAEAIYGWRTDEVVGKLTGELIPTVRYIEGGTRAQALAQLRRTGRWQGTVIQRHRDGRALIIDGSVQFVRDPQGRTRGIVAVNRDITERTAAQEAHQLLAATSAILSASLDYETTLQNVAEAVVPTFADMCLIDLVQPDGALQCVTLAHRNPRQREALRSIIERADRGLHRPFGAANVIQTRQPLLVPDVPAAQQALLRQDDAASTALRAALARDDIAVALRGLKLRSYLSVPLLVRGQAIGALTWGSTRRVYGPQDLALAEDLAERAAAAIDNARLYREAQAATAQRQRQAERLQVLAEMSRAFAAAQLDLGTIGGALVQRLTALLGDGCMVRLLSADGEYLLPIASAHRNPEVQAAMQQLFEETPQRSDEGFHAQVIRSGQPFFAPVLDRAQLAAGTKPEYRAFAERFGGHSLIVVPLRAWQRVLGTLTLGRDQTAAPYSADDLLLVQDLADRAALSITNAHLYRDAQTAIQHMDEALVLLDTLLRNAPIGLAFLDNELRYVRVNDVLARINGYPPEAHFGRTMTELLPALAPALEPHLRHTLQSGTPVLDLEISDQTPDATGQRRCWQISSYPVYGPDGQRLGIGVVIAELTERRRVERALRENEARFAAAVDNLPYAFVIYDAQLRYQFANTHLLRTYGLSATDLLGRRDEEIFPPERTELYLPLLQRAQTTGAREAAEYTFSLPDGPITSAITYVPLLDESGQVQQILGIAYDLTERKQAEEALRQYADRLQTLSRRLVEVQEAERRHIARELHDEIGQVLTGLKLTLDMAGRLPLPEIPAQLAEARTIINDLLTRVRHLSLDLRPMMLDDLGLIAALQWHVGRYTAQTGIEVVLRHHGLDRRFPQDIETTIYRIVQEALTNVARHAGVATTTVRLLADSDRIIVRVDDLGRGFDPEQALAAQSTSGLAGMRERVRLLHGELTIESAPGVGACVIAELPLAHDRDLAEGPIHVDDRAGG